MALPSTSVGGAFLSRQAARLSFESGLRLTRLKKLPGLANGLTSALQRNAFFDGKVAKPLGELGKVQDKILEKTPGSGNLGKASNLSGSLGAFVAIGGVAVIVALQAKVSEFVQAQEEKNFDRLSADVTKANELAVRANLANQQQELKFQQFAIENANIDQKINILNNSTQDARKLANDALYEARQGRTIVEAKVETARKQANDALYETRQGRTILENQIAQQQRAITAQLAATELRIQSALRANDSALVNQLQGRVNSLQNELSGLRSTVNAINIPTQTIDINAISANVRSSITPLINAVDAKAVDARFIAVNAGNKVDAASNRITGLEISNGILGNTIVGLAQSISTVDSKANNALREAQIKGVPTGDLQKSLDDKFNAFVQQNNQALGIRDLQQSNLSKEFDKKLADFVNQSNLTADQRFNQFRQENNNRLGVQDLKLSNLSNDFDRKFGEFVNLSTKTSQERFDAFQQSNQQKLGLLTKEVEKIDTRIKEQEKVNQEAIPKLDQLIFTAGLIPGRTADVIRPSIPTPQQINQAVQTGNCQSLNGGCSGKAMQDLANNINSNTQNANNDLLNKLNAGANASQLALLNTINTKLGGQIVGGISGKLVDGFKWLHLDRVLNVLTFAATVHNAVQLSNNIGQTLGQAIGNVLTLIGIKDDKNQPLNVNQIIGNSVENIVKGIVGVENYTNLTESWAKANRIYQATTNVINSFQNLSSTILNALEVTIGRIGKIGNALRASGEVLENAYTWMNPQPKINRVTQTLETLSAGASTIQMVTQAPLDVIQATTEMTNANTEFIKALKEDDKPANKSTPEPEPDVLKAEKAASKAVSAGKEMTEETLDPDED